MKNLPIADLDLDDLRVLDLLVREGYLIIDTRIETAHCYRVTEKGILAGLGPHSKTEN